MTDREIQQGFKDVREEMRRGFKDVREELRLNATEQNKRMDGFVTTDSWVRENGHLKDKIDEGDKDCRERTAAVQKQIDESKNTRKVTWDRVPLYLAVAATLIAAVWTAYIAAKGK